MASFANAPCLQVKLGLDHSVTNMIRCALAAMTVESPDFRSNSRSLTLVASSHSHVSAADRVPCDRRTQALPLASKTNNEPNLFERPK